jgi:hypothetical protein
MESFEKDTQVFIVRFWCESRELEGAHPIWRGSVEHLHSGQRVYVKNFKEAESVMSSFVPQTEATKPHSGWKKRLKSRVLKKE